jgi:hypothetical protein
MLRPNRVSVYRRCLPIVRPYRVQSRWPSWRLWRMRLNGARLWLLKILTDGVVGNYDAGSAAGGARVSRSCTGARA